MDLSVDALSLISVCARVLARACMYVQGVPCAGAEHGLEALTLVQQDMGRFSIVLMDNLMPVMNGVEATKQLRAHGFRNIIVGVTGNVMEVSSTILRTFDSFFIFPLLEIFPSNSESLNAHWLKFRGCILHVIIHHLSPCQSKICRNDWLTS